MFHDITTQQYNVISHHKNTSCTERGWNGAESYILVQCNGTEHFYMPSWYFHIPIYQDSNYIEGKHPPIFKYALYPSQYIEIKI